MITSRESLFFIKKIHFKIFRSIHSNWTQIWLQLQPKLYPHLVFEFFEKKKKTFLAVIIKKTLGNYQIVLFEAPWKIKTFEEDLNQWPVL